jgi:hypothetical protein
MGGSTMIDVVGIAISHSYRKNRKMRMMTGIGTPSSQSKIPRPMGNPPMFKELCAAPRRPEGRILVSAINVPMGTLFLIANAFRVRAATFPRDSHDEVATERRMRPAR